MVEPSGLPHSESVGRRMSLPTSDYSIVVLPPEDAELAVDVLCAAFAEYPVMRFVIDPEIRDYSRSLRSLIRLFVSVRTLRNGPILAVHDGVSVVAAATLTIPGEPPPPPELEALRDSVWHVLGKRSLMRYEKFSDACQAFTIEAPHVHLNMVGVRPSHQGKGLAGLLIDEVHRYSSENPMSTGVSLTTEDPRNVSLYQHLGYTQVGRARVAPGFETWGFFKLDPVG